MKGDWQPVMKKPVLVFARQMRKAFSVETLEGVMHGQPGDYLVHGVKGEFYPVRKDIFEETYEIVNERNLLEVRLSDTGSSSERRAPGARRPAALHRRQRVVHKRVVKKAKRPYHFHAPRGRPRKAALAAPGEWAEKDESWLRGQWGKASVHELAAQLGRKESAVYQRASKLGLLKSSMSRTSKDEAYMQQQRAALGREKPLVEDES